MADTTLLEFSECPRNLHTCMRSIPACIECTPVVCKKVPVGVVSKYQGQSIYNIHYVVRTYCIHGKSEKMLDVYNSLRIMPRVLRFIIEQFCVYTPTLWYTLSNYFLESSFSVSLCKCA